MFKFEAYLFKVKKISEAEVKVEVDKKPDIVSPAVVDIPDSKSDRSNSSITQPPHLSGDHIRVVITGTLLMISCEICLPC
jgi:hypothetical protein